MVMLILVITVRLSLDYYGLLKHSQKVYAFAIIVRTLLFPGNIHG